MAEPISLASGLLALSTFAFNSSITLYQTIKSFQNHPKDVRDLNDELEALNDVLRSLTNTVSATTDVDLSALDLPLLRCGHACKEFEQKLIKISSRSDGTRASFRGWAKLKYLGDDINSFKNMLAGYKSTINIALTDANFRKSSITAESLESHRDLIKKATVDLEARLEIIDEKLESILDRNVPESDSDAAELRQIKEERLSTHKCLEICARLSDHISKIQLRPTTLSRSPSEPFDSERITNEGLSECRDRLHHTAAKLERRMEDLINRLKTTMASEEGAAELATLQEEWGTARQCIDICSKADKNISIIDNYAAGDDSIQFLVSTKEKTIHGRNRGLGLRAKQVGGHLSDDSLQQISRDISRSGFRDTGDNGPSSRDNTPFVPDDAEKGSNAEFRDRYGRGFKLTSMPTQDTTMASKGSAGGKSNSPPR